MNRIEICGNIASGKTTFATLSQAYGYNAILEDFKKIPYLEDFYFSPSEFAFETEISFTLQHYYQIKKALSNTFITDFSLINDYAFALTTLSSSEFLVYKKVFEQIIKKIGLPDRIIKLNCPTNELLKRIDNRHRNNESSITKSYLMNIENNIEKAISELNWQMNTYSLDTNKTNISSISKHMFMSIIG